MDTNVGLYADTPVASLRLPRQAPGVHRGTGASAAVAAAGGVEAAGLFSWLGNLLGSIGIDIDPDVTQTLDDLGNAVVPFIPGVGQVAQVVSPYIP
ncbi:hypothetical protein [Streptomyces sp. NPDC005799]|uniref:hypothetical protein n=1 Tax=Streptomyces sp. NPDC005799 TaxID=3154678 RepID=UPI0033D50F9A